MADTFTLSGNVATLPGVPFVSGTSSSQVEVFVVASEPTITDTETNVTRLGTFKTVVDVDGSFTAAGLPSTADTAYMPSGFSYRIAVRYRDAVTGSERRYESNWFALTADTNFADVVNVELTAIDQATYESLIAARNQAVAAAATATQLATSDGQTAANVTGGTQTKAALTTTIDASVAPAVAPLVKKATLDAKGPGRQTDAMRPWRAALARREGSPADLVIGPGHSLFEGEGATAIVKRGSDRLRDILRNRFATSGVVGGYGHISPIGNNATTWMAGQTTFSGGVGSGNYGPGKHAYFLNAANAKVALNSIVCTAVDILYEQGGGGMFSTKTDGVANGDSRATSGSPIQLMKYRVPGITGAAAAHTVEVNYVSGNSIIAGFMVYNGDESAGIRVWNNAQGGLTSTQMQDPNNQNLADLANIAPDCVVVTCLANDYKTQVSLATSRANLVSIVNQVRAKAPASTCSLVFNVEHALGNTGTPTIPWSSYAALYYDVADQFGDIAVFDFYQRIGTQVPPTAAGMIAVDQQHYTDAGFLMWAEAIAGFLAP